MSTKLQELVKQQPARSTPLFKLAWRSLWRHKTRTTLLILVVAYTTFTIVFLWSFNNGQNDSMVRVHANYIVAPVQVTTREWFLDPRS